MLWLCPVPAKEAYNAPANPPTAMTIALISRASSHFC